MEASVVDNLDPHSGLGAEWEQLVRNSATSGIMQSLHWARFKKVQGLESLHVVLRDAGVLIGGAIFYVAPNSRGAGILVAPEGPVLDWSDQENAQRALRAVLTTAEKNAGRYEAMAVRVEPRVEAPGNPILSELGRAPMDLIPRETLYVELDCEAEQILARMKPKGRYNIRLASRKGVTITTESDAFAAAERLYAVLLQASQRDGFSLEPIGFFRRITDMLFTSRVGQVLFAEYEGETLGALLVTTYGVRGTYLYGGVTNSKRELMAGYLLQWAAMTTARDAGCLIYDFYGFDQFQAPGNGYARFSKFKSKFGGRALRFAGAHDYYFLDNLADAIIRAVCEAAPASTPSKANETAMQLTNVR